jgi:pimeloyl-ACP methyl ester carboxylesterase
MIEPRPGELMLPDGARLHYDLAGDPAGEPVVFVHGFSLDRRMWDDQLTAFGAVHRVVRYDARGFGRSSLPTGEYAHADDLRALLDHLDLGPVHLVGLSMGGGIAAGFALAYPDATRSLVLVDAAIPGYRWSPAFGAFLAMLPQHARERGVAAARELWLAADLFAPARERPAVAAKLRAIVADYSGWHWLHRDPERAETPPALERIDQVRAPTLLVLGERDLPDFHDCADRIADRLPGPARVVVANAGHLPNMEEPARFDEAVLAFLDRL